jgi:hypothetical protein
MSDPKQHHYVPEAYLQNFCQKDGTLWVYDKWEGRSFLSRPKSILKENFYYAQPDHKNKAWNHNIEKFFSKEVESEWPETVRLIQNGPEEARSLRNLYMFLYAMRVRVPNCRKAIEYALQQSVRVTASTIKTPDIIEKEREILANINKALGAHYTSMDELYDNGIINISIDPHRSLLAMADLAEGLSHLFSRLQLNFIRNCTSVDFCCSDNPVIYFPSGQQIDGSTPYQFSPDQPFEFIFPITKEYCLYHNSLSPILAEQIINTNMDDITFVRRINGFVGAFADRYVVSPTKLDDDFLPAKNLCPRPGRYQVPTPRGTMMFMRYEMGQPLRLPKWENKF